ncbi:MAG: hypothetical protein ACLQU2_23675 [Candidatus Binataceae bacterium]
MFGEVRAADLDDHSFSLRLDDGTKIVAPFNPGQEEIIIEALRGHANRRLRLSGHGELARNRKIKRLTDVESVSVEATDNGQIAAEVRPISKVDAQTGARLSEEERAKVPEDGVINFHHYLYAAPKEE